MVDSITYDPSIQRLGKYDGSAFIGFINTQASNSAQRTVSNKLSDVINAKDYGIVTDGVTDNTTAFQSMLNNVPAGAVINLPAGDIVLGSVTINRPVVIVGNGVSAMASQNSASPSFGTYLSGTRIKALSGLVGYVFNVTTGAVLNSEGHMFGVQFRNFYMFGNNRTSDCGAFSLTMLDHSVFEDIFVESFQREAISFVKSCRESVVSRLRTRFCGNKTAGTSYPCINLSDSSTAGGDPHNNISFVDCGLVYSLGDTVLMDTTASAGSAVRDITFEGCMFHGTLSLVDTLPYTITTAQKGCSLIVSKGGAFSVSGSNFYYAGDNVPHILLQTSTDTTQVPSAHVHNNRISAHYSGTALGYGIDCQTGSLIESGNRYYSCLAGATHVASGAKYLLGNSYIDSTSGFHVVDTGSTSIAAVNTFTPVLVSSGGGTPTYTRQVGKVNIQGDVMTFDIEIVLATLGTLAAGNLSITGLPFSMRADAVETPLNIFASNLAAGISSVMCRITNAAPSTIIPYKFSAGSTTQLTVADISGTAIIVISGAVLMQ